MRATKCTVHIVTSILLAHLLTGCASVHNVDKTGTNIGFEHFASKHYLLIETGKDDVQTLKVVSLPNLSKPRYIKHKSGWGSVVFSFKLQNGVLTDFGATHDSQSAATLTTLGTLGTAYGSLAGAIATAAATTDAAETKVTVAGAAPEDSGPVVTIDGLADIANNLKSDVVDRLEGREDPTMSAVSTAVETQANAIHTAAILDPEDIIAAIVKAQEAVVVPIEELKREEEKLKLFLDGLRDKNDRSLVTQV